MVAILSATYVNASKSTALYFYYAMTFDDTYVKMYGHYEGLNCINFNGLGDICGYYVLPNSYPGILPDIIDSIDTYYWVEHGYLIPFSYGHGVYVVD